MAQISRCARTRLNERPSGAGPQSRVGSPFERGQSLRKEDRRRWSERNHLLHHQTLALRRTMQRRCQKLGGSNRATLVSTVVPLAWVPKKQKLLRRKVVVWRHLWHPSDRAMVTRLFQVAHSIEHPCEHDRDIAWWARGQEEGREQCEMMPAGLLYTLRYACP